MCLDYVTGMKTPLDGYFFNMCMNKYVHRIRQNQKTYDINANIWHTSCINV